MLASHQVALSEAPEDPMMRTVRTGLMGQTPSSGLVWADLFVKGPICLVRGPAYLWNFTGNQEETNRSRGYETLEIRGHVFNQVPARGFVMHFLLFSRGRGGGGGGGGAGGGKLLKGGVWGREFLSWGFRVQG